MKSFYGKIQKINSILLFRENFVYKSLTFLFFFLLASYIFLISSTSFLVYSNENLQKSLSDLRQDNSLKRPEIFSLRQKIVAGEHKDKTLLYSRKSIYLGDSSVGIAFNDQR